MTVLSNTLTWSFWMPRYMISPASAPALVVIFFSLLCLVIDACCVFVESVTCSVGVKKVPASGLHKSGLRKPLFSDG